MRKLFPSLIVAAFAAVLSTATAQTPAPAFDKAAKQDTVAKIGAVLTDRYVFPDRAGQAKAKIDAASAAGDYDSISDPNDFAQRLTADLQSVTHDKHMRVSYMGGPPPAGAQQSPPAPPTRTNGGFARVDRLKGNIGYIRLMGFPPPSLFNPAANEAMRDLADTDALIIDMRDNGGGSAEFDSYFGSFFFDPAKAVQLNSIVNRTPSTNEFTTTEFRTKPVATSYVNKPVYILTSKRTFSGGEAFIYDLQVQKRVSIYGETTGGGANPGGGFPVGTRFSIFVPTGRAENPITKTNWEGVGVVPDHPIDEKLAFQAAMSDAVTQLLKTKINDPVLAAMKAALAQQTEPTPFIEAALLKFRTTASPGTEAALRRDIEGLEKGQPDYDEMSEDLANATRQQLPDLEKIMKRLGLLKSITFDSVGPAGADVYEVNFEHGQTEWRIFPLMPDGKLDGLGFRETTPAAPTVVPANALPFQTHFVTTNDGARLEVLDWGGNGRAIIFIPGLGGTAHTFDTLIPGFKGKYHVYTFTPRTRDPSGERAGDDVSTIIDTLKLNRPVLVGHSLACKELDSVGSRYPGKVAGLVYLDACFYETVTADGVTQRGPDEYPVINLPILAIAATPASDQTKIQLLNAFQAAQPNAHIVRIPNAQHNIWESNQADVLHEMNAFLDSLPR